MVTPGKNVDPVVAGKTPLLTERDLAAYLNVSIKLIQKWRYAGGGPRFLRVGASIRYRPEDIEAYVLAGLRTSTSM